MKELVIGIGEALFDMLPEGKKLGGAPANFAYHVSQFGINSCAVSAIGKDEQGRELTNELDSHNLKYQMDEVDYPTVAALSGKRSQCARLPFMGAGRAKAVSNARKADAALRRNS